MRFLLGACISIVGIEAEGNHTAAAAAIFLLLLLQWLYFVIMLYRRREVTARLAAAAAANYSLIISIRSEANGQAEGCPYRRRGIRLLRYEYRVA